jgi:hypothetical protein
MLTVIQSKIPQEAIDYVEEHRHLLTPDKSQYANERLRAWIGAEAPLSERFQFQPAPFGYDTRLWLWLKKFCNLVLNFDPEVALLHVGGADCGDPEEKPLEGNGGECGIKMHRDAGYADYRAVGINLRGEATFGYRCQYTAQDQWTKVQNNPAPLEHVKMTTGTCVLFNCKNPHFAQVGPNRWCINAWRISKKRRDEFEEFRKSS